MRKKEQTMASCNHTTPQQFVLRCCKILVESMAMLKWRAVSCTSNMVSPKEFHGLTVFRTNQGVGHCEGQPLCKACDCAIRHGKSVASSRNAQGERNVTTARLVPGNPYMIYLQNYQACAPATRNVLVFGGQLGTLSYTKIISIILLMYNEIKFWMHYNIYIYTVLFDTVWNYIMLYHIV